MCVQCSNTPLFQRFQPSAFDLEKITNDISPFFKNNTFMCFSM